MEPNGTVNGYNAAVSTNVPSNLGGMMNFHAFIFGDFTALMLLVAAALKFALVVGFYMHLRYESPVLSRFFAGGFVLAVALYAVVLAALGAAIFLLT